jgi:hypothetical protein
MTLSMYQASVPVFIKTLKNLSAILGKGVAYAGSKKIDPSVLVSARLAADMFPLARQVQIATDGVKGCVARLAGIEMPSYADTETTFPELQTRIAKTIAFAESVTPAQIDGSEEKMITLKVGGKDLTFKGQAYLLNFVMPNLFFHAATSYGILRHNGVEIGKMDFLGAIN